MVIGLSSFPRPTCQEHLAVALWKEDFLFSSAMTSDPCTRFPPSIVHLWIRLQYPPFVFVAKLEILDVFVKECPGFRIYKSNSPILTDATKQKS